MVLGVASVSSFGVIATVAVFVGWNKLKAKCDILSVVRRHRFPPGLSASATRSLDSMGWSACVTAIVPTFCPCFIGAFYLFC